MGWQLQVRAGLEGVSGQTGSLVLCPKLCLACGFVRPGAAGTRYPWEGMWLNADITTCMSLASRFLPNHTMPLFSFQLPLNIHLLCPVKSLRRTSPHPARVNSAMAWKALSLLTSKSSATVLLHCTQR